MPPSLGPVMCRMLVYVTHGDWDFDCRVLLHALRGDALSVA